MHEIFACRTLRIALTDYWADLQNDVPLNHSHHYMQSFDVSSNLTHLQESFTVSALAFTTSYSSNEQIIAAVLTTGLHLNSNPSVQYVVLFYFSILKQPTMYERELIVSMWLLIQTININSSAKIGQNPSKKKIFI